MSVLRLYAHVGLHGIVMSLLIILMFLRLWLHSCLNGLCFTFSCIWEGGINAIFCSANRLYF